MANFVGHCMAGIVTATIVSYLAICNGMIHNTTALAMIAASTLLGALFPDLDTKSIIQLWLYRAIALSLIVLYFNNITMLMIIVPVTLLIPMIVRHRGIFHQVWFLIFCATIGGAIAHRYGDLSWPLTVLLVVGFLFGAFSHLILDFGCITTVQKIIRLQ
ncbi:metal-dependent hydrolase [Candidatus Dependentiae bacterium]|nr:metal-dependent hydrolase [Candidatus Dependentiae bacterium]